MDEQQTHEQTDEEREFAAWVADLESDDEAAGEEPSAETQDDPVATLEKRLEAVERKEQRDELLATFRSGASAEAQELFETLSEGVEDPEQIKKLMNWAMKKSADLAKPVAERAEREATRIAQDAYGISPIGGGAPATQTNPQEEFDRLAKEAREKGDSRLSFQLFRSLPPGQPASPGD